MWRIYTPIRTPTGASPVVLLPGGGSCSLIWRANIEGLSRDFQTYALDNIYDVGRSVYIRRIDSGAEFATWLDELFDSLRLGYNVRIIGYSYGGWVASQYVLFHPERLRASVLIASACTVLPVTDEWMWRMLETLVPGR